MSIPKVVQDMADAAEAHRVALFETPAQAAPTPPAPAPVAIVPPAPPAAPVPPTPAPPAPAPVVPAPQVAPAGETPEHRYSVLKGKYDTEVPAFARQVRDLKRDNEALTQEVARLQEQLREAKPFVSKEEIEQRGEAEIDLMRRIAQEQNAPLAAENAQLKAQLARLQGTAVVAQTMGFYETLKRDHPDWAVINDEAKTGGPFGRFLDEREPLSGKTYQDLLEEAQESQDGPRASAVFTAFKRTRDSWAANAAARLETQVVPAQGAPALTTPATAQKREITRAEVNAHYEKLRRGGYPSQEAADAAEAEIMLATAEGRIK